MQFNCRNLALHYSHQHYKVSASIFKNSETTCIFYVSRLHNNLSWSVTPVCGLNTMLNGKIRSQCSFPTCSRQNQKQQLLQCRIPRFHWNHGWNVFTKSIIPYSEYHFKKEGTPTQLTLRLCIMLSD